MSQKHPELPEIFSAAIAIPDEKRRAEWVEKMTANQPQLRGQVMDLLDAHRAAKDFLSHAPPDLCKTPSPRDEAVPGDASPLESLKSVSALSPVVLRDETPEQSEPVVRPSSSEIPFPAPSEKYQFQGEIARGGVGAILQGRDVDLGRNLAIKVLLDHHKDNPQMIQRFVEEAQIGGQLQHPGITPVYELGQFPDQRPFFTMKLVKGKTLAAMLLERRDVFDRGRLLGIFEQICQTMAYAHSRGVIHRDLKPANIMVGAFGEVQVMDWGLAKVLESGGTADEKKARRQHAGQSVVQTWRSDGSGPAMIGTDPAGAGETLAGSIMGTPAYMPPEQARGQVDRLDERCDVFGLGAILCEILTGRPPYFDDNPREVLQLAKCGNLQVAFKDLDDCRADAELVQIAKECLATEPIQRIGNANILAQRVSAYLQGVEARLQEAELARAAEATRVIEARKRQRVTVALAVSILLTLGLGSATWNWNQSQYNQRRVAATNQVNEALGEARLQHEIAKSSDFSNKIDELQQAIASAHTANELAQNDALDLGLKLSANELLVGLQHELQIALEELRIADANQELKETLEFIRLSHADGKKVIDTRQGRLSNSNFNPVATRQKYLQAFRNADHDLITQTESNMIDWVKGSEIRETLISAMDHWSQCLPAMRKFDPLANWTKANSWEEAAQIAKRSRDSDRSDSLRWMDYGALLIMLHDEAAYQQFCREMLTQFGNESSLFRQEHACKMCLLKPNMVDMDALPTRWLSMLHRQSLPKNLRSWGPWAWNVRALMAYRQGEFQSAKEYVAKSESFGPAERNQTLNLCVRAMAEYRLGNPRSAQSSLEMAEDQLTKAMRISNFFDHDFILATTLIREAKQLISPDDEPTRSVLDQIPRWISAASEMPIQEILDANSTNRRLFNIANAADPSELRKSVRRALFEEDVESLVNIARNSQLSEEPPEMIAALATALREAKELELAESILRVAQRQKPDDFWVNFELGKCLIELGQVQEGLGFSRAALAIRPTSVGAMWVVTSALMDAQRDDEAIEQFKELLTSSGLSASGLEGLANSMKDYGNYQSGYLAISKAVELEPDNPRLLAKLAFFLARQGEDRQALNTLERAIQMNPDAQGAHVQHANLLWQLGREQEAIARIRKLIEKNPNQALLLNMLGVYLQQVSEHDEALAALNKAAELAPGNEMIRTNLATAYRKLGLLDEANEQQSLNMEGYAKLEQNYRKEIEQDPESARAHYDLGYVLYQQGRYADAAESFARSVAIDDQVPTRFYKYGFSLWMLDRKEDAVQQWKKALELNPELAKYHERVGFGLAKLGRNEEAIPYYQRAVELNPDFTHARNMLGSLLAESGKLGKAIDLARKSVENEPGNPRLYLTLATRLLQSGRMAESEQILRDALKLNPKQPQIFVHALGEIQAAQGNTEDAIATFENAIRDTDHSILHRGLGNVFFIARGDMKRAEAEFRKAIDLGGGMQKRIAKAHLLGLLIQSGRIEEAEQLLEVDPKDTRSSPRLYCHKIFMQFLQGEKETALKAIEQFTKDQPQSPQGYLTWAEILLHDPQQSGDYPDAKQAIELAQKSCQLNPNHPRSLTVLGIAQFRAGKARSAIDSLMRAEELGFRHPTVWLYLSLAYYETGNIAKSTEMLTKGENWIQGSTGRIPHLDSLLGETRNKINPR